MRRLTGWHWGVSLVVAVWLGLSAAGGWAPATAQETVRVFVGNVSGLENIDAKVAAVVDAQGRALAFMHSTDPGWNQSFGKVYEGSVSGNTLTARAPDGIELTATLDGNQIRGTVGGGQWLGTPASRGQAGLYRARYGDEVQLAIVQPDGAWVAGAFNPTTRELLRTWNSRGGSSNWQGDTLVIQEAPQAPPIEYSYWDSANNPFTS
jgi:hypothetical protein